MVQITNLIAFTYVNIGSNDCFHAFWLIFQIFSCKYLSPKPFNSHLSANQKLSTVILSISQQLRGTFLFLVTVSLLLAAATVL